MFSRMQLTEGYEKIAARFGAALTDVGSFLPSDEITAFDHALHPIIIRSNSGLICIDSHWGLVPRDWKKNPQDIWNHTISAKLEYLGRRYAWRHVAANRCLVPATAYFEYRWNDPKGRSKTKYKVTSAKEDLFALAGLFSIWIDSRGTVVQTFAICTTSANAIMEFVHNKDAAKNYHRMPVMLHREAEKLWLDPNVSPDRLAFPEYSPELEAVPMPNQAGTQGSLFSGRIEDLPQ